MQTGQRPVRKVRISSSSMIKKKRKRNYERRRYLWTVGGGAALLPSNHRKSSLNRGGNLKTLKQRKQEANEKNNKAPKKDGGKGRFLVFKIFFFFKFPAQKLVEESKVAGRPPERLFNPLPSPPPLTATSPTSTSITQTKFCIVQIVKKRKKGGNSYTTFFSLLRQFFTEERCQIFGENYHPCVHNFLARADVRFLL